MSSTLASRVEAGLPEVALEAWLKGLLPKGVTVSWEVDDCGEQTGDPAVDAGRVFPVCVTALAEVKSRARRLGLSFSVDGSSVALRHGWLDSPMMRRPREVRTLSGVDAALKERLELKPLDCPKMTRPKERREQAGLYEWCEAPPKPGHEPVGVRTGPARSWFSEGVYLMESGRYAGGDRVGTWFECSRFERCGAKEYGP